MRTRWSLLFVALPIAAISFTPSPALSAGEAPPPATATVGASPGALPELPRLAPIINAEPDPGALQDLDRLLARLTADDDRTRINARAAISEVTPAFVLAIRHRVQDIRGTLDREAAPRVIEDARKAGRKVMKAREDGKTSKESKESRSKTKKDDDDSDGDWLDFLLATPHPKDKAWQDVVRLVGMERMLTAIGTTPAVRELIALHAYFGDMLRIDLQRQISKLRDKAVPALIEARQHDAKLIQRWASKQLDVLGRAIPGEAVASNDTQILADVLRAYGRTRDVDAVRVILSFCNSDRIQLREASREAVAAVGEPGVWQLRDQYLNLTGNKAPREWTWDRIARELFALYDRARLAEVYKLMDDGVAATSAGKLAESVDAFDKVLARSPLFDRRKEMVKAYFERATQLEGDHREEALVMMRKAWRLDPKGEWAKKIEVEIAYLEGAISVDRGAPDKTSFERTLELDPRHERARAALAALEDKVVERQSQVPRYAAAGGLALLSLLAMILLLRRRSPKSIGSLSAAAGDAEIATAVRSASEGTPAPSPSANRSDSAGPSNSTA